MKRSWLKIIVLLVVIFGLAAGSYLVKRTQETRRGAAGENEILVNISPSSGSFAAGDSFTATIGGVEIEEGNDFLDFELKISFSNLTVENPQVDGDIFAATDKVKLMDVESGSGSLRILGFVNKANQSERGPFDLVKVNFKAVDSGPAWIKIEGGAEGSFIATCITTSCDDTIGGKHVQELTANYLIGAGEETGARVSQVVLSPSISAVGDGDEFTVSLAADSGGNMVSGASFGYSVAGGVEVVDVLKGENFFSMYDFSNDAGNRKMVMIEVKEGMTFPENYQSGQIEIAKFKLKKTGVEPGSLFVNNIEIVGAENDNGSIVAWSQTADNLTSQYKLLSAGDIQINFKVKFEGVNRKIGDQVAKVKVVGQGMEKTFSDVGMSANDEGIFSGRLVLTDALPGSGYALVIKGPKHLGTKFCQNNQAERCRPGQSLTLAAGENNFDFSAYPLPPGDVSGKDGKQDGVVDVEDFDAVQAGLDVNSSAAVKEKGDLNFDGVNNGSDPVLFLKTMAEKYDDDI